MTSLDRLGTVSLTDSQTDSPLGDVPSPAQNSRELSKDLYGKLRSVAASYLSQERRDHTLQPTALANEAYLKLLQAGQVDGVSRGQLIWMAARAMRQILVDHARKKRAQKRSGVEGGGGGGGKRVPLDDAVAAYEEHTGGLPELDSALQMLERVDPELLRIVELRFFGGLTEVEISEELGVSVRTVRRGWSFARLWLADRLRQQARADNDDAR
jgi:RNA polymerase sigma-70 factor, ECF subfamily